MTPYPLLLHPLLKERVWGGRTLERFGKQLPAGNVSIGESWEVADLPEEIDGGQSTIANGELAGMTLHTAIAKHPKVIMGAAAERLSDWKGFPLLIKYLDAQQNLSVQVHPDEAYARAHPGAHVKSEAWVVVDAKPGAVICKGLKPGVTREVFARHIATGEVVDDLITIPVQPGDCHYLPSGTCHALGAGILVAEVQTPSDTTFRVYDWGRTGPAPHSGGRELHIAQALECMFPRPNCQHPPSRPARLPRPITSNGITTTALTETEYFTIERVNAEAGSSFRTVTQDSPEVWMMLTGSGQIEGGFGRPLPLRPGVTTLIPAAADGWKAAFSADSRLLLVLLPSPLRNMLARFR